MKSFGWYEDAEAIYIAMEYFQHGDLHNYLSNTKSRLPVEEAQELTRQILEGLAHMHTNGFAHRDIKPGVSKNCSQTKRLAIVDTLLLTRIF